MVEIVQMLVELVDLVVEAELIHLQLVEVQEIHLPLLLLKEMMEVVASLTVLVVQILIEVVEVEVQQRLEQQFLPLLPHPEVLEALELQVV